MIQHYQWRTSTNIISGGYPGEATGVEPPDTGWRDTTTMLGSMSASYYFRDSNLSSNNNSSRVLISITESWVASFDPKSYLTVTLNTTVNSIVRDDVVGSPGNIGRNMFLRRENGGPLLWSISNDNINTPHTIMGSPLVLDPYTFTIAPGEGLSRGSIYFRANVVGHDSDPTPSSYVDLMWFGTEFKNPMPKDYRPGATLKSPEEYGNITNGVWVTNDDRRGAAHVLSDVNNMTWVEMRTVGGDSGELGNPPSILKADDSDIWFNQKGIGKYVR